MICSCCKFVDPVDGTTLIMDTKLNVCEFCRHTPIYNIFKSNQNADILATINYGNNLILKRMNDANYQRNSP